MSNCREVEDKLKLPALEEPAARCCSKESIRFDLEQWTSPRDYFAFDFKQQQHHTLFGCFISLGNTKESDERGKRRLLKSEETYREQNKKLLKCHLASPFLRNV